MTFIAFTIKDQHTLPQYGIISSGKGFYNDQIHIYKNSDSQQVIFIL